MRKIVLYARVSTVQQEKEQTIQAQLVKIKEVYKDEKIIKRYLDEGFSGAYLSRPSLNQLREDAKTGLFNTVVLYAFDRLSRNVGHQLILREEFKKYGVQIEILGKKLEDTPQGEFNDTVLAAAAQLERALISQRAMDGKWARAKAGKLIGCKPPFGYIYVKKSEDKEAHFKINLEEARVIKKIFKVFSEENSINKTTNVVNKIGLRIRDRRTKELKLFYQTTIAKILRNESYIGNWYYGKRYACEAKYHYKKDRKQGLTGRRFRPKSEWCLIKIPAIIDKLFFNKVQKMVNKRREDYLKPTIHFYLCQGLVRCVHCGRKYAARALSVKKRLRSPNYPTVYFCSQKYRSNGKNPNQATCHSRTMSGRKVDSHVWEYISSLIQDTEKVKKAIRALKEKRDKEQPFNQEVYNTLIDEKSEIKTKKQRLLDLYVDSSVPQKDLDNKMAKLNDQEGYLDSQIEQAERELRKIKNLTVVEAEIEQLCLQYKNKISNITPELKKFVIRKWVKEINILDNGDIAIRTRLPELKKATEVEEVAKKSIIEPQLIPNFRPQPMNTQS